MNNHELNLCVKEYMDGNIEKFNDIYYETKKIVYLSIYSILGNSAEIEDIMQDTYMKMINNLDSYKLGTNFKAWISSIARNLSLNEYNKKKRIIELGDDEMDSINYQYDNSLINSSLYILNNDTDMKQIFVYRIIFNMGFRDISDIMNIPKSTIHDTYKKMIKIIKENLEEF